METTVKFFILLLVLIMAGGAIGAQFFSVRQLKYEQSDYTTNAGELVSGAIIGQTFQADEDKLSAISLKFATYSGRDNTKPVEFHLRRSIEEDVDLRTGEVRPEKLGDNQFYRFEFEPVNDSRGQIFFFYVISPQSRSGDAVTVDIDTRDPYHLGSAYLLRDQKEAVESVTMLARSGKPTIDLSFGAYYTVSFRVAMVDKVRAAGWNFIGTWDEQRGKYIDWARAALPVIFFVGLMFAAMVAPSKSEARRMLLLLFVLAIAARVVYAIELPVTNDEGNYLYDARTLLQGNLAGGDGYVKAPLMVLWVAGWQLLFGSSIIVGRLSSVVISALTIFPIYWLGKQTAGKRAGIIAAAAWALLGVTTVFGIYVHTQPLALFFGISGLAVLYAAVKRDKSLRNDWFIMAGVLLGLGVISRKSILALGLVPILLIFMSKGSFGLRLRRLVVLGASFVAVVGVALVLSGWIYGVEGFWEAVGMNSAEDGIVAVDPAEAEQVRAYSIRGMTPFFRESLPLILLAMAGLGVLGEKLLGLFTVKRSKKVVNYFVPKLAWVVPAVVFWWAWRFFAEYEGSSAMVFGMWLLWYAMAAALVVVALLPRKKEVGTELVRNDLISLLVVPVWILGLVFFYVNWIKFHANYIGEFLPPLVLLAGVGAPALWERLRLLVIEGRFKWLADWVRGLAALLFIGVLLWALFVSNYVTYMNAHTGTFEQRAACEAATWAKDNISSDEPIFTGAALIPFLSGHHTVLDIAHPRWYAYEFTRKDTSRLNTFLPPIETMLEAYRNSNWFLLDKQTGFSFLMEYSEIEAGLEKDWEVVKGIENGSNTLTFYRRKEAK